MVTRAFPIGSQTMVTCIRPGPSVYLVVMFRRLLKRLIVMVTLGAFVGAGVMQIMPPAEAQSPTMTMKMNADGGSAPVPCKNTTPGCTTDMGCIFMVGVPVAAASLVVTDLEWSRVTYWGSSPFAGGFNPEPAIGPPISIV
jgi:hypothetical protein